MRLGNVEGDYNRYLLFPLWYLCQKKKKKKRCKEGPVYIQDIIT